MQSETVFEKIDCNLKLVFKNDGKDFYCGQIARKNTHVESGIFSRSHDKPYIGIEVEVGLIPKVTSNPDHGHNLTINDFVMIGCLEILEIRNPSDLAKNSISKEMELGYYNKGIILGKVLLDSPQENQRVLIRYPNGALESIETIKPWEDINFVLQQLNNSNIEVRQDQVIITGSWIKAKWIQEAGEYWILAPGLDWIRLQVE